CWPMSNVPTPPPNPSPLRSWVKSESSPAIWRRALATDLITSGLNSVTCIAHPSTNTDAQDEQERGGMRRTLTPRTPPRKSSGTRHVPGARMVLLVHCVRTLFQNRCRMVQPFLVVLQVCNQVVAQLVIHVGSITSPVGHEIGRASCRERVVALT